MIVSLRIWLYQFLNRFGKHSIQTLACVVFLIKECSCNDGVFRFFWIKSFFQMYFFLIYIAAMTVPALCYGKGIKQLKELKLLSRQTVLMLNSKGSMYRKKRCTWSLLLMLINRSFMTSLRYCVSFCVIYCCVSSSANFIKYS